MAVYYSDYWEVESLLSTGRIAVVNKMKQHFSMHGLPEVVVFDNGVQFVVKEFTDFTTARDFEHVTTLPYQSQSNGKVESTVKICKTLACKATEEKTDLRLAMVEWRNTSTVGMDSSPVQRLMSR